jgi:hypothetical protein
MTHAAAQAFTTAGVSVGLLVLPYVFKASKVAQFLAALRFWANRRGREGDVTASSRGERLSRSRPSGGVSACAPAPRALRLAYLTAQYRAVSHTFIRRELLELERRGHHILRLAIRRAAGPLPDPADRAEEFKTVHCLAQPMVALLLAVIRCMAARPFRFVAAIGTALTLAGKSDRGLVRHVASRRQRGMRGPCSSCWL